MHLNFKYLLLFFFCFCLILLGEATSLFAQEGKPISESQSESQPKTLEKKDPTTPDLYPFIVPYLMMRGITYPLHRLEEVTQKHDVTKKTVDFMANTHQGFSAYPLITVGDGGKFGGGVGIIHPNLFDKHYILSTQAILFTDLGNRGQIWLGNPEAFHIGKRAFSFLVAGKWYYDFDEDYYGIGPKSLKVNKSEYSLKNFRGGASVGIDILPRFMFTPYIAYDYGDPGPKRGGGPPSSQIIFPPSELIGFDENISYLDMGFRLIHDNRDQFLNPSKGGFQSLVFHHYNALNHSGFNFFQLNLNVEHYFRLGHPRLILALHNAWVFQQKTKGNQIPFFRLASLDVNSPLRGYDMGRFRDEGMAVFNAELRYPLWRNIDGELFVDGGQVFKGIKNFSFKDFKYSVGGGIRFTLSKFFLFKTEVAYGGEGVNVIFKASQYFPFFMPRQHLIEEEKE